MRFQIFIPNSKSLLTNSSVTEQDRYNILYTDNNDLLFQLSKKYLYCHIFYTNQHIITNEIIIKNIYCINVFYSYRSVRRCGKRNINKLDLH